MDEEQEKAIREQGQLIGSAIRVQADAISELFGGMADGIFDAPPANHNRVEMPWRTDWRSLLLGFCAGIVAVCVPTMFATNDGAYLAPIMAAGLVSLGVQVEARR